LTSDSRQQERDCTSAELLEECWSGRGGLWWYIGKEEGGLEGMVALVIIAVRASTMEHLARCACYATRLGRVQAYGSEGKGMQYGCAGGSREGGARSKMKDEVGRGMGGLEAWEEERVFGGT